MLLWMIFAILGVFAIVLLCPKYLYLQYQQNKIQLFLHIGFAKFRLFPRKTRKNENATQQTAKPKNERPKPTQNQLRMQAEKLLQTAKLIAETIPPSLKTIIVDDLTIRVRLNADDPADLALYYGQAWAVIGSLLGTLQNIFTIKHHNAKPVVDDTVAAFDLCASIKLHIATWQAIGVGIRLLKRYLAMRKAIRHKYEGKKNYE